MFILISQTSSHWNPGHPQSCQPLLYLIMFFSQVLDELTMYEQQDSSQVINSDKACFMLQLFKKFNRSHLPELYLDLCKNVWQVLCTYTHAALTDLLSECSELIHTRCHFYLLSAQLSHPDLMSWLCKLWPHFHCLLTMPACHCTSSCSDCWQVFRWFYQLYIFFPSSATIQWGPWLPVQFSFLMVCGQFVPIPIMFNPLQPFLSILYMVFIFFLFLPM